LMETMLEQSVRSSSSSLRQQSSSVFVDYLLNYPLGEQRIEQHLKQIVLNLKYEYSEGRLSAVGLLSTVIDKLPSEILETHYQLFFLPLTLQLANDEAEECRQAIAKCIATLLMRLSAESLQTLYDYVLRWSIGDGGLKRTSLQLLGIYVGTCPSFVKKRQDRLDNLLATVESILGDKDAQWETTYFGLICAEKVILAFKDDVAKRSSLWNLISASLRNKHPWVRKTACRILAAHLSSLTVDDLSSKANVSFLKDCPGSLHELARNFCHVVNLEEEHSCEPSAKLAVQSLTWILQAMHKYPELCFSEEKADDDSRDPVTWLITRLSNTARPKGSRRRQLVYKCFAAFATFCSEIIERHLELIIEPLYRSELEARNVLEAPGVMDQRPINDKLSEELHLAKDVLHLLEEHCDNEFLNAYAAVKKRAQERKEKRKSAIQTEAVTDPQQAAKRRIEKQDHEKRRRKRRVEERRSIRGGTAKRRHLD
jgi:U3 small nucleolar RNA-associated protein 20